MRRLRAYRPLLVQLAVLCLWGCPRPPAGPDAGAPSDAGRLAPAALPPLVLTLSAEPSDATPWSVRLTPGERLPIGRAGTLTLRSNLPLRNYRVRIFDEADRALESDDQETRSGPSGMEYLIALGAPLLAGHRYALVVDPQTPGPILDADGRTFDEMRFELQVAGEREKGTAKPARHRRHRRP